MYVWVDETGQLQRSEVPPRRYLSLHTPPGWEDTPTAKLLHWIKRSHPAFLKGLVENPLYKDAPPTGEQKEKA